MAWRTLSSQLPVLQVGSIQACTSLSLSHLAVPSQNGPCQNGLKTKRPLKSYNGRNGVRIIGKESVPIQLAQCRFPGLAIPNAEILVFFHIKIRKQFYQTALGNCYGLKLPKCCDRSLRKKIIVSFIIIMDTLSFPFIHCKSKKQNTKLVLITFPQTLTDIQNSSIHRLGDKLAAKSLYR